MPQDDNDDVDGVFMPIKSNDDDEPVRILRENELRLKFIFLFRFLVIKIHFYLHQNMVRIHVGQKRVL